MIKQSTQPSYIDFILCSFFILMLMSSLNNLQSRLSFIGAMSLLVILTIPISIYLTSMIKNKKVLKTHHSLIIFSIILLLSLTIGWFMNPTLRGTITYVYFSILFLFMLSMSTVRWTPKRIRVLGMVSAIFVISHFIYWIILGFPSLFRSYYNNSNLTGAYMYYSLFFLILARISSSKRFLYNLIIILCLLVLIGSGTRSVMVALSASLITYFVWKYINKRKAMFVTYFLSIFTLLISFIFIYPLLPRWKYYSNLEFHMLKYTNKSIMSGRAGLWEIVIQKISQSPIFGFGTGVATNEVTYLNQSTHNLYLQIVFQNGGLGLFGFIILALSLWLVFWKSSDLKTVQLSASFFIGTLVYQSFETTFIQNTLSVGAMQWFIIAIGISAHIYRYKEK